MEIAEISINYKPLRKLSEVKQVIKSKDAADFFRSIWSDRIHFLEEFYMLMLNRNKRILGYLLISVGGTTGTVVDTKIVFQGALKANANSIIVCHNHPSGNLSPSEQDIKLTRNLKEAGKIMDIQVLDHVILSAEGYFSFSDEGMM